MTVERGTKISMGTFHRLTINRKIVTPALYYLSHGTCGNMLQHLLDYYPAACLWL